MAGAHSSHQIRRGFNSTLGISHAQYLSHGSGYVPSPSPQSLRSRGDSRRGPDDGVESDVVRRYSSGDGCVKISMDTGLPLSTVIKILKEDVCNGRTPNM